MKFRARVFVAAMTASALALTACGGGASDTVGASSGGGSGTTVTLIGYAVPKNGWDAIGAAFAKTDAGKNVTIQADYGASGSQSRKVADGAPADIVNFSVEPDVTRLVKADKVDSTWNAGADKGIPFGSVVSIVVRQGNPKGIKDWGDLLRPDVSVISPSPLSSGSAKWNLLAPYAAASNGGVDRAAGLNFITELVKRFPIQPDSGRSASEAFVQGQGDVLLSYENEALLLEQQGQKVEHFNPPTTFRIDNPVAVVKGAAHTDAAKALNDFLYTDDGQKVWAEAGFRPVNPDVAAQYKDKFPTPARLFTIDDLGGWSKVDPDLFGDNGAITAIYKAAK